MRRRRPAPEPDPAEEDLTGAVRALEWLIDRYTTDPEEVLAEAAARGLHVAGATTADRLLSLRANRLEALDALAASSIRRYSTRAGLRGFLTGLGGAVTIPFGLTAEAVGSGIASVRMTSAVMNAYGFETTSPEARTHLKVAVAFSLGAERLTVRGSTYLLPRLAEPLANRLTATVLAPAISRLAARQMTQRLALRGAVDRIGPRMVPVVGGVLAGGLNVGVMRGMGRRVQALYRARLVGTAIDGDASGPWPADGPWPAPTGPPVLPPGYGP